MTSNHGSAQGQWQDDSELLDRFRNGCPTAATTIIREFQKPLLDFIRKQVPRYLRNNAGGTVDLTQSVLLDLLQNPEQQPDHQQLDQLLGTDDSQLWRLLVSIVFRHHAKHKKRNQRQPQNFRVKSLNTVHESDQHEDNASPDVSEAIDEIQQLLTSNEQMVFTSYWIPRAAGVRPKPSQRDVADNLNLSVRTVERAMKRIKEVMSTYSSDVETSDKGGT